MSIASFVHHAFLIFEPVGDCGFESTGENARGARVPPGGAGAPAHAAGTILSLLFAAFLFGSDGVSANPVQTPENADARLSQGLVFLRSRDFQRAREEFKAAIQANPALAQAHLYLGVVENQLGSLTAAISHLREALRLDSTSEAVRYNLGLALLRVGNSDEAAVHFQEAVERNPALTDARYNLGILLSESGRFHEAIPHLEAARKGKPGDFAGLIHLARAYLGDKQSVKVVELLSPMRRQRVWQVHYLLGLAFIDSGKTELALPELREAVRLKADDASVHYTLGSLLLRSKERSDQNTGAKHVEKAIDLAPNEPDYYITLGRWLIEQEDFIRAVPLLRRAVEKVPPSIDLYLMLGLAEAQVHGAEVARPFIERAVAMNPKIAPALNLLGNCYFRLGSYGEAANWYRKAVELNPQSDKYHYDLGLALERHNRPDEALPFVEKAIQIKPGHSGAHYLLGKLHLSFGRLAEAVKEFEICARLEPEPEFAYYQLARAHMRLGDAGRAQEWNAKLNEVKAAKDKRVGLAPPESATSNLLESVQPWEPQAGGASSKPSR